MYHPSVPKDKWIFPRGVKFCVQAINRRNYSIFVGENDVSNKFWKLSGALKLNSYHAKCCLENELIKSFYRAIKAFRDGNSRSETAS